MQYILELLVALWFAERLTHMSLLAQIGCQNHDRPSSGSLHALGAEQF